VVSRVVSRVAEDVGERQIEQKQLQVFGKGQYTCRNYIVFAKVVRAKM